MPRCFTFLVAVLLLSGARCLGADDHVIVRLVQASRIIEVSYPVRADGSFGDGTASRVQVGGRWVANPGIRVEGTVTPRDDGSRQLELRITVREVSQDSVSKLPIVDEGSAVGSIVCPGYDVRMTMGGVMRTGQDGVPVTTTTFVTLSHEPLPNEPEDHPGSQPTHAVLKP